MAIITASDLTPFANIDNAKALAMIEDAEATAMLVAPCLSDPEFAQKEHLIGAAKAVLRGAILRWNDAGTGVAQTQQTGPFVATLQPQSRRGMFWPSEIAQLQELCSRFTGLNQDKAFMIDMVGDITPTGLGSRPDLWFQNVNPTPPGTP